MNADKDLVFNRRSSAFIGGQFFFINHFVGAQSPPDATGYESFD
jgi:hypothetical protein